MTAIVVVRSADEHYRFRRRGPDDRSARPGLPPMPPQQRSLFDEQPEPWELDDRSHVMLAQVVFAEGLSEVYTYRIPAPLSDQVVPGKRVRVPLGRGNRLRIGYCVEVGSKPTAAHAWKDIVEVLDTQPLVTNVLLRLTQWMADHYLISWGKVLEGIVPAGVRGGAGTRPQTVFVAVTNPPEAVGRKLSKTQAELLVALRRARHPLTLDELTRDLRCTAAPLRRLVKRGLVEARQRRIEIPRQSEQLPRPQPALELNSSQLGALTAILPAIQQRRHETFLLHGVTGSGKTEVYIQAIEQLVRLGQQAIVLVPEISLTPQTQRRFSSRFPRVAVLHSHLTDAERSGYWRQIARGDATVIVGARSAVFAPAVRLGLIVIDEEHDSSFKQDSPPRYHARDVARERARSESIPLILGSATPSLETWRMAELGEARLLSMPRRVLDLPLPDVVIVDMRFETRFGAHQGPISRRLQLAMRQALDRREQIILLLNRRGFSTHVQCPACGRVLQCPDCEMALTHHREGEQTICHYCDYRQPVPKACPKCAFAGLRFGGLGTQRLETVVRAQFPLATILRMDSDTMRQRGSHEESLNRFRQGQAQVLVGTQMIAKGLDFPNVTVVGVINADTALHLPDFRAAERTFQLVTQVAGRTGRGAKGGRVFVQTYSPDHLAIRAAERHDYRQFAAGEMPIRQQFGYPPFGRLVRLIVRGTDHTQVEQLAAELADRLVSATQHHPDIRLLGPAPAPIAKLRGQHRYHLIVQASDLSPVRGILSIAQRDLKGSEELLWQVDVDPWEML